MESFSHEDNMILLFGGIDRDINITDKICIPAYLKSQYQEKYPNIKIYEALPAYCNKDEEIKSFHYIMDLYHRLLDELSNDLSRIHSSQFSNAEWMILLGQWLLTYLFCQYSLYLKVSKNANNLGEFRAYGYHAKKHSTPMDTLDSINLMKSDDYCFQSSARILEYLGYSDYITYFNGGIEKDEQTKKNLNQFKHLIKSFLHASYNKTTSFFASTLHYKTGFSFKDQVKLLVASGFKISRLIQRRVDCHLHSNYFDEDKRKRSILNDFLAENEFEKFIKSAIWRDIPRSFIENYSIYYNQAKKLSDNYRKISKVFTSTAIYFDEQFKYFLSVMKCKGCTILATPHGGQSGVISHLWNDLYEKEVASVWYSWGWSSKCDKIKDMPASLLIRYNSKYKFRKNKFKILYGTTTAPQQTADLLFGVNSYVSYMAWQRRFIRKLDVNIFKNLMIRLHREDAGWGMKEHFQSSTKNNITFEGWDKPFPKSLQESVLYVVDHCSTTYVIAMAMNVPTVLYWNPELFIHTTHADVEIKKLKEVGIFHDTPESAAKHINSIIDDVYGWWLSDEVQRAKDSFCYNYARTDKNALKLWKQELLSNV